MSQRLFPNIKPNNITGKQIDKIINIMVSKSDNADASSNVFAGFTYLGQMIAHDIVKSTNNSSNTKNFDVNPSLMLDSIYGNKEFQKNREVFDEKGRFKFSDPINKGKKIEKKYKDMDIRRVNGKALIADQRNDENFIISQLHLFWQKLHNIVIDHQPFKDFCIQICSEHKIEKNKERRLFSINLARNLVIKTFQQIIIEDYLYNILDLEVYETYIEKLYDNDGLFFYNEKFIFKEVPLEFSHAVFRFGHSMVKSNYKVNERKSSSQKLEKLFNQKHNKIKINQIVDWKRFFGIEGNKNEKIFANRIDDLIVNPMSNIPCQKHPIIRLNIMAGYCIGLPSGIQILKHIRTNFPYAAYKLKLDKKYKHFKKDYKSTEYSAIIEYEDIPLWLFILLEARFGKNDKFENQQRLGRLGSAIVAEVILQSIKQADISVLNKNKTFLNYRDDIFSRFNIGLLKRAITSDELYINLLNDFRRFKMIDLINVIPKI